MDIREVYSAMEQKVIDGHENPYNLILDSRFFEVQKYVSNTGHFFDFIAVVANKKFEALTPEYQQAIKSAMAKAVATQRVAAAKADVEALAELQKKGMQYDEMPACRARSDAQGHRRRGRRHQEARRRRSGRPRAGRGQEGVGLLNRHVSRKSA